MRNGISIKRNANEPKQQSCSRATNIKNEDTINLKGDSFLNNKNEIAACNDNNNIVLDLILLSLLYPTRKCKGRPWNKER